METEISFMNKLFDSSCVGVKSDRVKTFQVVKYLTVCP